MKIYVKAGDREAVDNPNYEYTLRDGHIIQLRPDEEEIGKSIGYSIVCVVVPVDFWELRGTRDWKSDNAKVREMKKYIMATYQDKYPWDVGYINPVDISSPGNKVRVKKCDWFIDWQWMLDQKLITQNQYKSIYNFEEKTDPIIVERDFTQIIFNETQRQRLKPGKKNMAWTSGTKEVASSGGDYTTWKLAVDDMGTATGNMTIEGKTAEEISDDTFTIDNNMSGYLATLTAASGQKHNGGAYGSGHRILFGTWDRFGVDEVNAGEIDDVIIQDLALNAAGAGNYCIYLNDGGDAGHIIVQRLVIIGNGLANSGITLIYSTANAIVRNNSVYDFTDSTPNKDDGNGIIVFDEYGGCTFDIYNNTCCKNSVGISNWSVSPAGTMIIKNNLCVDNQYNSTDADYYDANSGFDTTSKNVSSDATSPDGATYQNWAGTANMEDYTNDDFRLASTDATLDDGDDLSGIGSPEQFSDDIEDQARSTWYIGISEIVAAAGAAPTAVLDGPLVGPFGGPI